MNPIVMLFLVLFVPMAFLALAIGPLYLGMVGSIYFYYTVEDMWVYASDPNYIMSIHEGFYKHWQANPAAVDFMHFFLPVYGPVVVGSIASLLSIYAFTRYIRNVFVV